jgi:hypothetical protein
MDRVRGEVERQHHARRLPGLRPSAGGDGQAGEQADDHHEQRAHVARVPPMASTRPVGLLDVVRRDSAAIAASARWVRIEADAPVARGGLAGLDASVHFLDGEPEEVARYVLVLDAINFGSGGSRRCACPAASRPPRRSPAA